MAVRVATRSHSQKRVTTIIPPSTTAALYDGSVTNGVNVYAPRVANSPTLVAAVPARIASPENNQTALGFARCAAKTGNERTTKPTTRPSGSSSGSDITPAQAVATAANAEASRSEPTARRHAKLAKRRVPELKTISGSSAACSASTANIANISGITVASIQ